MIIDDARIMYVGVLLREILRISDAPRDFTGAKALVCRETDRLPAMALSQGTKGKFTVCAASRSRRCAKAAVLRARGRRTLRSTHFLVVSCL